MVSFIWKKKGPILLLYKKKRVHSTTTTNYRRMDTLLPCMLQYKNRPDKIIFYQNNKYIVAPENMKRRHDNTTSTPMTSHQPSTPITNPVINPICNDPNSQKVSKQKDGNYWDSPEINKLFQ